MAETKLALSLDALIAQAGKKRDKKPPQPRPAGGQAPQAGPRKGLNKNRQNNAANGSGAPQQQRPKQQQQQQPQQQQPQQVPRQAQVQQGGQRNRRGGAPNLGVRGGQVQKQRRVIEVPEQLLRAPPQLAAPQRRQVQQLRLAAPEGKWQHDLYEDNYPQPRRAPLSQAMATSSKLIVKNLHHQVSTDDLLELFSTCGAVKAHAVNFDNSGRSIGTGWVHFETRAEAEAAKKEYNGVKLDGQAMDIYFSDEVTGLSIKKLSSGISVQKPGAAGANRSGGMGGSGGAGAMGGGSGGQRLAAAAIRETAVASRGGRGGLRGGGRLRSAVVGRAQLDSDLRDYMQE